MRTILCLSALATLGLLCAGCQENYVKKKKTDGGQQREPGTGSPGSGSMGAAAADPDSPFASLSLDEAFAKAKSENKLVFVDFYAEWCGPCKMLDSTTWRDAKVKEWMHKHTIAIKVDVDKEQAVAAKYKIEAMPTMILLTADGKVKKRSVGYQDAGKFMGEFGPATN